MKPEQIKEQIRYHMREIEELNQHAAFHQELIDGLNAMLWEQQYENGKDREAWNN